MRHAAGPGPACDWGTLRGARPISLIERLLEGLLKSLLEALQHVRRFPGGQRETFSASSIASAVAVRRSICAQRRELVLAQLFEQQPVTLLRATVGVVNDALKGSYGAHAVRYSLLSAAVTTTLGALLLVWAARTIRPDIERAS